MTQIHVLKRTEVAIPSTKCFLALHTWSPTPGRSTNDDITTLVCEDQSGSAQDLDQKGVVTRQKARSYFLNLSKSQLGAIGLVLKGLTAT